MGPPNDFTSHTAKAPLGKVSKKSGRRLFSLSSRATEQPREFQKPSTARSSSAYSEKRWAKRPLSTFNSRLIGLPSVTVGILGLVEVVGLSRTDHAEVWGTLCKIHP